MVKRIGDRFNWTATNIKDYLTCPRLFYYQNFYPKLKEIPIPKYFVVGIFVHRAIENFWVKKGDLITQRYGSETKFANAAVGRYKSTILAEKKIQGRPICFDEVEKYSSISEIRSLCKKFAEMQSRPPALIEQKFKFSLEGRIFSGKIDEIRIDEGTNEYIIRDYKTGFSTLSDIGMAYDPQFTLYTLAFGVLANQNESFAEILGIPTEERSKLAGNPYYFYNRIRLELFNIRNKEIKTTYRKEEHYPEFIKIIDDLEAKLQNACHIFEEEGDIQNAFPRNPAYCGRCSVSKICDAQNLAITVPEKEFKHQRGVQKSLFLVEKMDVFVPRMELNKIKEKKIVRRTRQQKLELT